MAANYISILAGAFAAVSLACAPFASAQQNCDIHLMVVPIEQGADVNDDVEDLLMTRLTTVITGTDGVTADPDYDRFFITGKFNHLYQDVVAGPPMSHVVKTMLTLYIGDNVSHKIYSTTTMELKGVGTSETRAIVNALGALNRKNSALTSFVEKGTRKVLDYYNKEYPVLIRKAETAAAQRDYGQALNVLAAVPECCSGYKQVESALLRIYNQNVDFIARQLLAMANAAWGANPTSAGAREAYRYLVLIDPASSVYPEAQALHREMKKIVKDDYDFENREKYHDAIALEQSKIEAARAVGVAFGNHQQPTTEHYNWIR
ncbi:MAG: hypothetical protein J6B44_07710 [Muribaculaceae bacterium]|nr:hypothetical protein [Muribaculaceae bacterium]